MRRCWSRSRIYRQFYTLVVCLLLPLLCDLFFFSFPSVVCWLHGYGSGGRGNGWDFVWIQFMPRAEDCVNVYIDTYIYKRYCFCYILCRTKWSEQKQPEATNFHQQVFLYIVQSQKKTYLSSRGVEDVKEVRVGTPNRSMPAQPGVCTESIWKKQEKNQCYYCIHFIYFLFLEATHLKLLFCYYVVIGLL